MTTPLIHRADLEMPGDVAVRPHGNCYWLVSGRILAGEHPGAIAAADIPTRVDALLGAGIRQFVDLTEEGERVAPYNATLRERASARGIRVLHHRFAIRDFGVPSARLMRTTLDAIYGALAASEPVYVHCWAGIGRTGTVVGCLLREQGLSADEAFGTLAAKWRSMEKRDRHPTSPEWPGQFEFIEKWTGA